MENIIDKDILRKIIKQSCNDLLEYQENKLVLNLYHHIEYTREKAFQLGYKQGRFDEHVISLMNNVF